MFPKSFLIIAAFLSLGIMLPIDYLLLVRWPTWIDYILRAMLMNESTRQMWAGDLYPRWLTNTNAGLGSPVMLFQPMLAYYFASLWQPIAFLDPNGFFRITLCMSVFIFMAALGCYAWLREYFAHSPAQQGAILYAIFPTNFIPLYFSMNINSFLAFSLFPWMLFIARKMCADPKKYFSRYSLLQAALIASSLWNTVIFSAVPLLSVFFLSDRTNRIKNSFAAFISAMIGIAIAAIYWIPLLANKEFILYGDFTRGYLHYSANFLTIFRPTLIHEFTYVMGWMIFLLPVIPLLVCGILVTKKSLLEIHKKECLYFFGVIFLSLFMSTPASTFIWENVAFLGNIQMPLRFSVISIPAVTFIMTCWLSRLKNFSAYYTLSLMVAILVFLFSANYQYLQAPHLRLERVLVHKLIPQNTHMTIWMSKAGIKDSMTPPARFLEVPPSKITEGEAEISDLTQETRSIHFKANVSTPTALVTLKRYYYPGWIVADGFNKNVLISENDALLTVSLPRGEYEMTLIQPWFPGEKLGMITSLGGLCALALWQLRLKITRSIAKNFNS